MSTRLSADQAKIKTNEIKQKAQDMAARAKAKSLLETKISNYQQKKIINAALEGRKSTTFFQYLCGGSELIKLGYKISKVTSEVSEHELIDIVRDEKTFEKILDLHIEKFVRESAHNFQYPEEYSKFIRSRIDYFISKADGLYDTKDSTSFLNFMNSEGYSYLGIDGGWNNFANSFVKINRVINFICINNLNKINDAGKRKYAIRLLPSTTNEVINIDRNLIELSNDRSYFLINWSNPKKRNVADDNILLAERMLWLSSDEGQKFFDFIFGKIQKSIKECKVGVEIPYEVSLDGLKFQRRQPTKHVSLDQLVEILSMKKYKVLISGRESGIQN